MKKNNISEISISEDNKTYNSNLFPSQKNQNSSKNDCCCFSNNKKCSSKILYLIIVLIILLVGVSIFLIIRLLIVNNKSDESYFIRPIILNETNTKKFNDNLENNNQNIIENNTKEIKIGIYISSYQEEEIEKSTLLFLKYLSKEFNLYLFSSFYKDYENNIPENISKIIINKNNSLESLKSELIQNKIDIFIYQDLNEEEINFLNNLKNIKIIFFLYTSGFYRIYFHENKNYKNLFTKFQNSKYIISLTSLDNDYLFKKLDFNIILMNNFILYDYDDISPSDLSSNKILMISKLKNKYNKIDLGIKAMKYIVKEIPNIEMIIILNLNNNTKDFNLIKELKILNKELNLENNIKIIENFSNYQTYLKNSSLHIITSVDESFPFVLSETKLYGIPNVVSGLDYIPNSKEGVIFTNDDQPETIAKEAIKILKDGQYKKKLGKEARESMKNFKNELTSKKWIKVLSSIYNEDENYNYFINKFQNISKN